MRRVRAADTAAGQVVICSGMAQGLGLVLRALAGHGLSRVGFEDPGSPASMTAAAAWAGVQAVPVRVDDRGVDVAALEATAAGAVVLTPAPPLTGLAAGFHAVAHLPTGTAEHQVIQAARSHSVGLYGRSSCRADHALDPPQLVLGFGNTSQRAIRAGIAVLGDVLSTA